MNPRLHVGIVGSRRRNTPADRALVFEAVAKLYDLHLRGADVLVVSGGCRAGADRFARVACEELDCPILEHLPDITPGMHYHQVVAELMGRNTLIARDARDLLIALPAPDRTGGTEDTIRKYERLMRDDPDRRLVLL